MHKLCTISILLFAMILIGCRSSQSISTIGWQQHQGRGFTIKYPNNWSTQPIGNAAAITGSSPEFLATPNNLTKETTLFSFSSSVNVLIQNVLEMDLDRFTQISKNQITTMLADGKILEEKDFAKKGVSYKLMVYQARMGASMPLTFFQVYTVVHGKAYLATYTCLAQNYSSEKALAKAIVQSLDVLASLINTGEI